MIPFLCHQNSIWVLLQKHGKFLWVGIACKIKLLMLVLLIKTILFVWILKHEVICNILNICSGKKINSSHDSFCQIRQQMLHRWWGTRCKTKQQKETKRNRYRLDSAIPQDSRSPLDQQYITRRRVVSTAVSHPGTILAPVWWADKLDNTTVCWV